MQKRANDAEDGDKAGKRQRVEQSDCVWTRTATSVLVFTHPECKPSAKVAAFDLDGTIVTPKSGKKFPQNRADWQWANAKVCAKLKEAHESGCKIVLFSNQAGLANGKAKEGDITGKITDVFAKACVPFQAFAASAKDRYRKPSPDLWALFADKFNGGVAPDLAQCYYVGDAAGRADGWAKGKKKDHSCGDRQFARNVGIAFHTPEEYFLGEKAAPFSWGLDPATVLRGAPLPPAAAPAGTQEMILLVGFPASGKSSFCRRYLASYARINRDTLKTKERCVKECRAALADGRSVAVDNLNTTREQRREYLALAKDAGVPARCFHLQTSIELALHLNAVRERLSDYQASPVPTMVFYKHRKDLEAPTAAEGFAEVVRLEFVPEFDGPEHEAAFNLFYDA